MAPFRYLDLLFHSSAQVVQWREKELDQDSNRVLVERGVALARQTGRVFLINSELEMALEVGAHGVHLTSSQDSRMAVAVRRERGAERFLIGKSVHCLAEALDAQKTGVDYALLSPVFDPISKPARNPALGLTGLREVVGRLRIPVIALGGMQIANFAPVLETGVLGIAGISWLVREITENIRKSPEGTHERFGSSADRGGFAGRRNAK